MRLTNVLTVVLTAMALLTLPVAAHAHFVWIETEPAAQPGRSHEIHVYFGEPHELLREESGGRLDQHEAVRAWIVDPGGEKTEVALRKEINRFTGVFTPQRPGLHQVLAESLGHDVMDLSPYGGRLTKPLYYARAQFLSWAEGRVSERVREIGDLLGVDVVPVTRGLDPFAGSIVARTDAEFLVRVTVVGKPLAGRRLHALGPNGWVKELQPTDSLGITSFVPLWSGRYVVVVEHDEKTPGEERGRRWDVVGHRAALTIPVAPTTGTR